MGFEFSRHIRTFIMPLQWLLAVAACVFIVGTACMVNGYVDASNGIGAFASVLFLLQAVDLHLARECLLIDLQEAKMQIVLQPRRSDEPNKKRVELQKWIEAIADDIAAGGCDDGILEHIQKHTGDELLKQPDGRLAWVSSMENLLDIYKSLYKVTVTDDMKLQRLRNKYEKDPGRYTANPASVTVPPA